jgi:hypothetical protein
VYNSFNSNTKLFNSSRFKLGKVTKEYKVKEKSLGNNLNTYYTSKDKYKLNSSNKDSTNLKSLNNNKEIIDFKEFSLDKTNFKRFSN